MLEATVTPILNVIKVTHNSSNNDKTLIDKKFLIIRLQYYVIEFGLCLLANRTLFKFLIFIKNKISKSVMFNGYKKDLKSSLII